MSMTFKPWEIRAARFILGVWLVIGVPRYVAYLLDWLDAPDSITVSLALLLALALLPVAVQYFRRPIPRDDP